MSDPPWAGIIDTQRVKKRFYPGFLNIDRAPVSNLVQVCFSRCCLFVSPALYFLLKLLLSEGK